MVLTAAGRRFHVRASATPRVLVRARSAISVMVSLAHTDLLAMLPVQWAEFPLTRDTLQTIRIREVLPASPIVVIRPPDLPLTPAAEHFCDLMKREVPTPVQTSPAT